MSLIIKNKIQELVTGYPTVSDKYDIAGAILTGANPVQFGDLVKVSTTNGYFEAIGAGGLSASTLHKIGGIVMATNVKVAENYPATTVQVNPNEAFNLFIGGFIAVKLVATAVAGDIYANAKVYVTANGVLTTATDANALSDGGAIPVPNMVFTGMKEQQGRYIVAEVYVK